MIRRIAKTLLAVALLGGFPVEAAQPVPAPLLVRDDRGGAIVARIRQVRALRQSGRDVRIVGSFCYSSCTLLLGLPGTCVSPRTVFGFHGPSRRGHRLDEARFERASHQIAGHYPAPLRDWYMTTARYRITGIYRRTGADLIAMGLRAC